MTQTKIQKSPTTEVQPVRMEEGRSLLIAGLHRRYTNQTTNRIPAQWQRFTPYIGRVSGQIGQTAYGVCWCPSGAPEIEYLTGVEVAGFSGVPAEFSVINIPGQQYAVFVHSGHVSQLRETLDAISKWLPQSDLRPAAKSSETPDFLERYTEEFNAQTGVGGIEVWVPIQRQGA